MRVLLVEDEARMASVISRSLAKEGLATDVTGSGQDGCSMASGAASHAIVLDPARREVRRGETEIELSAKEFALLETLVRRRGEVLSRFDLIEHAWDLAYEIRSNVVDVYVRRLRQKVDRPFGRRSIETVRG